MLDVDSNLSSSQRVGYGASVILKQDLWDFGRTTNAVKSAELENELQKKQDALAKAQVQREVLATYLDCSFLKTQLANSTFIIEQAKMLGHETDRFVKSGQRSIIERYMVETELKSAETRLAEYTERLHASEERLGILLQKPSGTRIECDGLPQVKTDVDWMSEGIATNPILEVQKSRSKIAESKLAEAKAEYRPKIFGMALAGTFDNDHLNDQNHYAAGVGITWPLFSGFLVDAQNEKRQAELLAEQSSLDATKQKVDTTNSTYDERIRSLRVRLQFLDQERAHARKVFDLAHKRYEDLQGSMIDLRDAVKFANNLVLDNDQTLRDFLFAEGEKALFNGFDTGKK